MPAGDAPIEFEEIARAVLYLVDLAIARDAGGEDSEHERVLRKFVTELADRSRKADLRFEWGRFEFFSGELADVYRQRSAGALDETEYGHRLRVVASRSKLDRVGEWKSPDEIREALWLDTGTASEDGTVTIRGLGGHKKAAWFMASRFFDQSASTMRQKVKEGATRNTEIPFGHAPSSSERLRWVLRLLLDDESDNHDAFAQTIEATRNRRRKDPRWAVGWPTSGLLDAAHYVRRSSMSRESWVYDEMD